MTFSLATVDEADRLAILHDVYGPALNMHFDPLSEELKLEGELRLFNGVAVMHGCNSPFSVRRGDVSRENDDFLLVWPTIPARGRMTHLGREIDGADGAAVLVSCPETFAAVMHSDFRPINVRIPRAMLMPLLPVAEQALMRPVPRGHPPFRLLNAYLEVLHREPAPESPELGYAIAAHLCDLVALSIGASRDGAALAASGGVRAARLAAVKQWALDRLGEPGLSVADAAAAQRVSARYIQMLFEREGTTFSGYLRGRRLALAHRRLADPRLAATPISAIAYESGFGDLSYFNRAFRTAFGEAPSDVRHRATGEPHHPTPLPLGDAQGD